MDLVKISATGGFTAMAALALAASARPGSAQAPVPELPLVAAGDTVKSRIDAAFDTTARPPVFDASGPLFPRSIDAVPALPAASRRAGWPPSSGATAAWSAYIDEAAARFALPAAWLHGVMQVESGGRTHVGGLPITSAAGAMGLMQVMPTTFADMRARYGLGTDPYDPRTNILAGAAYLREMYDRYGVQHFLAAYNAGPGRIDAWLRGRATLPAETRAYNAALLPRLGFSVPAAYVSTAGTVQDLTSHSAMAALFTLPSRPAAAQRADIAAALVLAARSARASAADRPTEPQSDGGLFVTLSNTDRRRAAAAAPSDQD